MIKHYSILILLFLITSCSQNDSVNETVEPGDSEILDQEDEIKNLAPGDFEIDIKDVTSNSATISWSQAEDPENDPVTYTIYLNENLIVEGADILTFQFVELKEFTTFTGELIATDVNDNETSKTFSFTTDKYYLKYLKTYDFGQVNNDIGYAHGKTNSMIRTNDQNYLIAGSAENPDDSADRFFVLKIDFDGNEVWKKFYNYPIGNTTQIKIIESSTGYIVVGRYYILSLDFFGDLIWDRVIDTHIPDDPWAIVISVVQDKQGNILTVGDSHIPENPDLAEVAVLTKYDISGNLIWEKRYGTSWTNDFQDIIISAAGELLILGTKETSGHTREDHIAGYPKPAIDFWVLKLSGEGEEIWNKTYGDYRDDFPRQILQKKNGNYVISGYGLGAYDISKGRIIEIDQDGNELLNLTTDLSTTRSISETLDEGLVITGTVESGTYGALGIYKYDSSGNEEWNQKFQESFTHLWGYSILTEPDGGYRIAGTSWRFYYYDDEKPEIIVYKTDPQGFFK